VGRLYLRLAPPPITVIDLIFGALLSQAVSASAQLGIADALAAGPLAKEELARRVGADPDSVARPTRCAPESRIAHAHADGVRDDFRTVPDMVARSVASGRRKVRWPAQSASNTGVRRPELPARS
jgi:hypothetical protein